MAIELTNQIIHGSLQILSTQIHRVLPSPALIAEGGRILDAALPLIALYKPAGSAFSYGATTWNLCQKGLHFYQFDPRTPLQCLNELIEAVKTVAECASVFFNSTAGHLIYSALDLIDKLKALSHDPSLKKVLPVISRGLYLFIFFKGNSLHNYLFTLLLHASSNLFQSAVYAQEMHQSGEGWRHEKNLACLSKMFMGIIQVCQASHCISQINVEKSFDHPLKDLAKKIDAQRVILTDAQGKQHDFGAHFHGYGKGLVKGMNISFIRTVLPGGSPGIELSFKLNHVHREHLEKVLEQFSKLTPEERKDFLESLDIHASDCKVETSILSPYGELSVKDYNEEEAKKTKAGLKSFLKSLNIEAEDFQSLTPEQVKDFKKAMGFTMTTEDVTTAPFLPNNDDESEDVKTSELEIQVSDFKIGTSDFVLKECHKVTLEGLGSLLIGRLDKYYEKDRLFVLVEEGKDIDTFLKVLAPMGLSDVLQLSSPEDILRMKVGLLFRAFFPHEAFHLERSERFFDSPFDQLKAEIIEKKPEMAIFFPEHLSRMEPREVLPGYFRYAIPGLGQNIGVRALTHSLMNQGRLKEQHLDALANIFKVGLLSKEWQNKSYENDYWAEDVVYTQAVVEENIKYSHCMNAFSAYSAFQSNNMSIRLFLSAHLLEMPTFQYFDGHAFGSRDDELYSQRPSTNELIQTLRTHLSDPSPNFDKTNYHEIMIKDRIPPEAITGMFIEKAEQKELIVSHFRKTGIIHIDSNGNETINGIPLDKFIHTGSKVLTEAMVEPSCKV